MLPCFSSKFLYVGLFLCFLVSSMYMFILLSFQICLILKVLVILDILWYYLITFILIMYSFTWASLVAQTNLESFVMFQNILVENLFQFKYRYLQADIQQIKELI